MEFIPALKLGVAVLTNADDGNPASYCDYALQLLTPIVAKEMARAAPAFAEDAERYCATIARKRQSDDARDRGSMTS